MVASAKPASCRNIGNVSNEHVDSLDEAKLWPCHTPAFLGAGPLESLKATLGEPKIAPKPRGPAGAP